MIRYQQGSATQGAVMERPCARIRAAVAARFGVTNDDLVGPRRERQFARPRMVAMFLTHRLTAYTLPQIGQAFGGRDHTTVIHACRRVPDLAANDASLARTIAELIEELRPALAASSEVGRVMESVEPAVQQDLRRLMDAALEKDPIRTAACIRAALVLVIEGGAA